MSLKFAREAKEIETLKIYRGDLEAGELRRKKNGCEFQYSQSFLAQSHFSALSYRITKFTGGKRFQGDNLPAFFAGLLPEGFRLRALVQKIKTSEDDLFSLLAATGHHCIGDVYVYSDLTPSPSTIDAETLQTVDFYELLQKSLTDPQIKYEDASLAGVQEKLSASMISFPLRFTKKNKSYILKLNPKDKPGLVTNEYECLKLAQKCGIEVNSAKIIQDANQNEGLLVERFDRFFDSDQNKFQMIHQEDACQFLDRYPADKYRLSLSEIAEGILELSAAPAIEILKLLKLYAFSYLIGNGDLHAKNISLKTDYDTGKITLTPAYDLICTYIYGDHKMALKINGRDDNIKRRDFIEFGIRFNVPEMATASCLDSLITKIKANNAQLRDLFSSKQQRQYDQMFQKRSTELGA